MKDTIKVVVKEPGKPFEVREVKNTLGQLQELVGGYIETVTLYTNAAIICNEEGRLKGLPEQRVFGAQWAGTVALVGVDGDEFDDVPEIAINHPKLFGLEE